MYAAIIPPRHHLGVFSHLTKFQLVVPDHFNAPNRGALIELIKLLGSKRGHYIILDNGTYERGGPFETRELLDLAEQIGANELVVPDVFQDMEGTIKAVETFFEHYLPEVLKSRLKLMVVPQGKDFDEWLQCLKTLQSNLIIQSLGYKIVWGMPKWLSRDVNRFQAVYSMLPHLSPTGTGYQYHMLGCMGIWELRDAPELSTVYVRSIDTSLPIKAGIRGASVLYTNSPVSKGTTYIDSMIPDKETGLVCANVIDFLHAVPNFKQFYR